LYTLNEEERVVQKIVRPMFAAEGNVKNEIREFLLHELKKNKCLHKIIALIFYGSMQTGKDEIGSDVDIAVVVKQKNNIEQVEAVFTESG
jgi:predicted nucleotidyltransferase